MKAIGRMGIGAASVVGLLLAVAGPAGALSFQIGGVDSNTQYTGAGTGHADAGVLTFDDQFNGTNTPELGIATTADAPLATVIGGKVWFKAELGPLQQNGSSFVPATSNVRQAIFLGTGFDFGILSPVDNTTVLLAFDLNFIDVTQAALDFPPADPDGHILLGDPSVNATTSLLTVAGGTLNQVVGGIGAEARLEILFSTITPPLLVRTDRQGYLNTNFMAGVGSPPVSDSTWNLTIIVPEPSAFLLLGVASLGLLGWARRAAAP